MVENIYITPNGTIKNITEIYYGNNYDLATGITMA